MGKKSKNKKFSTSIVLGLLTIIIVSNFVVLATPPTSKSAQAISSVKPEISKVFEVTLPTGDVVTVGVTKENETEVLAVKPYDPTKLNRGFRVFEDAYGLYVVPNDVDLKKVDINLFNVKLLIEENYTNSQAYPLITVLNAEKLAEAQSFVKSIIENNKAGKILRSFKIIPGESLRLVPGKTFYDLMSSNYVRKIWLNYKVKVNLNASVPLIGAPYVWSIGYNGSGVKIAILDTGIDNTHPDFYFPNGTSKIKVNVDFTDDHDYSDFFGHGTHVASIASGTGAGSIITPIVSEIRQLSRSHTDEFARISTNGTHIAIVWHSDYTGNYDIWFLLIDGRSQASPPSPLQLTTDANVDAYPFVTFLKNGKILVLWTSNRTGNIQIWYKVYDKGEWSQDKQLTLGSNWHVYSPVTQLSNGSIAIAYTSNASSNRDVWFAILNLDSSNTLNWVSNRRLTSANSTMWLYSSSIVQSTDGKIWVFIFDLYHFNFTTNIGGITQIYYNVSSDMGATWLGGLLASGSGFVNPSATVLPDGTMVLVLEGDDLDRNIPYTIWYMVYRNNTWLQPRILTPGKYLAVPSIVYAANLGKFVITAQNWINSDLENDIFLLTIPIFRGVAPGATLWNLKVLNRYGWGYWDWIIAGIEYAAYGPDKTPNTGDEADIISMSLGSSWPSDGTDPVSLACDAAADAGRVVVVAAGNSWNYFRIGTPAASRKAITVGALDKYDNIAWFSSRGPTVDFRIKPDLVAPGVDIIAARSSTGWFSPIPENSYYTQLSGTSMATPHVSGVVALLLQARAPLFKKLPVSLVATVAKDILISTSKDIGYDVYTQGGGRVNALAAASTELIPDPATVSLGRVSRNTTYSFVVTFYNVGTGNITISLTPRLYSIWYNYNATGNVKLNTTILRIPANGSKAVEVEVNTTLPAGYYSGEITTNYTVGGSYVHTIFGFALLNKVNVTFLGLDGKPLANAFIGAFKANATYQEVQAWYPIRWIWSYTDSNGTASLYTLDGIYYIVGNDGEKSNYASAYAINKTYIDKDVAITLDLRLSHKVSYVPPAPNQVVAWLSSSIRYTYQNSTNWPYYRYGGALFSSVYYPASTDIYISSTDLLFFSYYQHYDKSYINVPDPSVLNAPELYSIPFVAKGIYQDVSISYGKSQLVRVARDYRVASTPSIAAKIWREVWGWYHYGYDWYTWAPSLIFTITAPKGIVEYLLPTWLENISLSYSVGYWKMRDQPNIVTPYFSLGGGGEHYHTPGNYSDTLNGHPFAPSIDVWISGSNTATMWLWTDIFQNSHVYRNARPNGAGDTIFWIEALRSDSGRLVVKSNDTVIYNSSFYDWNGMYLGGLQLPARFEIDLYGQSNMWLSSSAYTKIEFEVPVYGYYSLWNPIWRIVVNGLDSNNTIPAGAITGYIVTNLNTPQPPNVTSVEYSVDDGATWKLAQVNMIAPYNFSFLFGNVPGGSYVSLRINLTNPKMSYTVLRGFYVLPTITLANFPEPFVTNGIVNTMIIVGASNSRGPCSAAHTIDVGAGMYVAFALGKKSQQGVPSILMDWQVANYNGTSVTKIFKQGNIITFGGLGVNLITWYYHSLTYRGIQILAAYMASDAQGMYIYSTATGTKYRMINDYGQGKPVTDYAMIVLHYDNVDNRYVLIIAGLSGYSTSEAAKWLSSYPNISGRAVILKMTDNEGDGIIDSTEIAEIIP
jgi:subtilisin family serine protease